MNLNEKLVYFVSICGACTAVAYIAVAVQALM